MKLLKRIVSFFSPSRKHDNAPLLIITTNTDNKTSEEYLALLKALETLEKDPSIPKEKLEELKKSIMTLSSKNSITINSGEILE